MLVITAYNSGVTKLKFLVKVVPLVRENLPANMTLQCLKMAFIQRSKRHLKLPFSNSDEFTPIKVSSLQLFFMIWHADTHLWCSLLGQGWLRLWLWTISIPTGGFWCISFVPKAWHFKESRLLRALEKVCTQFCYIQKQPCSH